MAIYRNVQMSFWTDRKIDEDFTPADKYLYLFFLTNPMTNLCGCYEIGLKQIARMTGYDVKKVKAEIERLQNVHGVIVYAGCEVLLVNWHKFNWTSSEKFRKPLLNEIQNIKDQHFKGYMMSVYEGADSVSIPYQYGSDTTDAVTVTDTVHKSISKKEVNIVFKPPTVEEVRAYCQERGNTVDPEQFVAYYGSQKWRKANGQPLSDWRKAIVTWEKREAKPRQEKKPAAKGFDYANQRQYSADDMAELKRRLLAR